jgi:uncharacterized protein DUF3291
MDQLIKNYHLAQLNIGKILAPMDNPVMQEFAANLDTINLLAEGSPGFIWRFKDENNDATSVRLFDDDLLIINMSVWEQIADLFAFTYKTAQQALARLAHLKQYGETPFAFSFRQKFTVEEYINFDGHP